jgi:hypothetical protein
LPGFVPVLPDTEVKGYSKRERGRGREAINKASIRMLTRACTGSAKEENEALPANVPDMKKPNL